MGEHDTFRADLGLMLAKLGITQMHGGPLVEIGAFAHEQIGALRHDGDGIAPGGVTRKRDDFAAVFDAIAVARFAVDVLHFVRVNAYRADGDRVPGTDRLVDDRKTSTFFRDQREHGFCQSFEARGT